MLEPRTAVMILVEASWKDENGIPQLASARMEDRSTNGACIRLKTRVPIGLPLRLQSRWLEFAGIVRYCRRDGYDYVVGLQQENAKNPEPPPAPVLPQLPQRESISTPVAVLPRVPPPQAAQPAIVRRRPRVAAPRRRNPVSDVAPRRAKAAATSPPPKETAGGEAKQERKSMARKWLEMAPWHGKPEGGEIAAGNDHRGTDGSNKENFMSLSGPPERKSASEAEDTSQIELVAMEDIYRAAGIMLPRKGYSIKKVVEMLNSEHIRNLTSDMKRVAILMALDAAGVPITEVLQDAKARQQALDAHEAEQRKRAEDEWTRKAEENVQIEAELERIKAHHMARIARNLDAIAREKAVFTDWLTQKQQESQSMTEAAELCSKPGATASAPAASPSSEAPQTKTFAKTV